VPLPKNPLARPLGKSRPSAVHRFLSLKRSLHSKNYFDEFVLVMNEYMDLKKAESVPEFDLQKPMPETFYLLAYGVRKEESATTKLKVIFDDSTKSISGVSLNDSLLVGPTIHSSLIDVGTIAVPHASHCSHH